MSHWRGWIEARPKDKFGLSWIYIAPKGYEDVKPTPPPNGTGWT